MKLKNLNGFLKFEEKCVHFSEPQIEDLEVCLKYMDYLTIEHVEVKSDDIHEIAYVHELEATV